MQSEQLLCWSGMTDTGMVQRLVQTKKKIKTNLIQIKLLCDFEFHFDDLERRACRVWLN